MIHGTCARHERRSRDKAVVAGLAALVVSTLLATSAFGQNDLRVVPTTVPLGATVTVPITMSNANAIEAYTLALGFDTAYIDVTAVEIDGSIAETVGAEGVYPTIYASGFILGVFLDTSAPFDGQTIAPGTNQLIAGVHVTPTTTTTMATPTTLGFVDGVYGSPAVINRIIEDGGTPIGAAQGLELIDGELTLTPEQASLSMTTATVGGSSDGLSTILLDNPIGIASAFTVDLDFDADAILITDITTDGTATADAAITFVAIDYELGRIDIELDPLAPTATPITSGSDIALVVYQFACLTPPVQPDPADEQTITFGSATQLTLSGTAAAPATTPGTVICEAIDPPNSALYVGVLDGDAVVDPAGQAGETLAVGFFYSDPDDPIQGFQLAVVFDCALTISNELDTSGTVVGAVGAEFVATTVDHDPDDGDGCEFTAGILLDAVPPFEDQTVPATLVPLAIGTVQVTLPDDATSADTYAIDFVDFIDGSGSAQIENIVVIDFASITVAQRQSTSISILESLAFRRGDATADGELDLADLVVLLAQTFEDAAIWCYSASDTTADQTLDLADFFALANYLFLGGAPLPEPFADCGAVAGADCDAYDACP